MRRHQERLFSFIRLVEGDCFQSEVSVPQGLFSIDALLEMQSPSLFWGTLRQQLAKRYVVLEHFSRPPKLERIHNAEAKLKHVQVSWAKSRPTERSPVLLVLSCGVPRYIKRGAQELEAGIYQIPSLNQDEFFINIKGLSQCPTWYPLRATCEEHYITSLNQMAAWLGERALRQALTRQELKARNDLKKGRA